MCDVVPRQRQPVAAHGQGAAAEQHHLPQQHQHLRQGAVTLWHRLARRPYEAEEGFGDARTAAVGLASIQVGLCTLGSEDGGTR